MKLLFAATLVALAVAGCGGGTKTDAPTTESATSSAATSTSAAAAGCSASGLDAMTVLSKFQLEMNDAQKAGKITLDQLIAARDKLFNETEAAADKEDWTGYCKSIDDMRAELGL